MPPRRVTRFFSRLDSEGWISDRPSRVLVVATDGMSTPRVVTPGPFQAGCITWSPDGTRIAFASARHDTWDLDGVVDIWTVAADGSDEPQRVTETEAAYYCAVMVAGRIAGSPVPLVDTHDEPRHFTARSPRSAPTTGWS